MPSTVIAFDADDTLWVNETFFLEAENEFCALLSDHTDPSVLSGELFRTQIKNLGLYGYGAKAFTLSMIEAGLRATGHGLTGFQVAAIIELGKKLLDYPIELLDGVKDVLRKLQGRYKLVVATKGDLLDQERKLKKSGLAPFFDHIEIMSDKKSSDYRKLLDRLRIEAADFVMIGNSLKSDILPVLELGGRAFYVPFLTTWAHEKAEEPVGPDDRYHKIAALSEVLSFLL